MLQALEALLELDASWPVLDEPNAKLQTCEGMAHTLGLAKCVEVSLEPFCHPALRVVTW